MIKAQDALDRLREGNTRYVAGLQDEAVQAHHVRRQLTVDSQLPFAIILGCSDSRVPAEIVFDQGLGDLFVIRIAGNIVAPSQIGSVEFAASQFGTRLVVVLGHTQCGAVLATLEHLRNPGASDQTPGSLSIVERIGPAIRDVVGVKSNTGDASIVEAAVRANIKASVRQLLHGSALLEGLVADGNLRIVGAEYSLETGVVTFLEE
ncbi:MAG: carbonic anhydrase [Woeseiaceae bacterium]|nr:carbonic anhydrase [Woeseiaceae bacterium]